jgi:hypothetical protein
MDGSDASINETPEEAESMELLGAVDAAIKTLQGKLKSSDWEKGLLADLVRLLQLRKELDADRPRYVGVRWIDECEDSTRE